MQIADITPIREGKNQCPECQGVGFYLEPHLSGTGSGELFLCNCLKSACRTCPSGGKQPYMVYEESMNKMVPCVCHDARISLSRVENLVVQANIPPRYKYRFLNNLDTKEMSFLIAHDWAHDLTTRWKEMGSAAQGLYLWGATGTGKTLLACAVLNELILRYQVKCKYAKISTDFLNAIRGTYSRESEEHGKESTIMSDFINVDVLVIDDFGVQKETDWSNSKLYDLIDARYEREKLTILTSNTPLTDWKDKAEGRIYSRLMVMTKEIHLEGEDYRLRMVRSGLSS